MSKSAENSENVGETCALCDSKAATVSIKKQQFAYRDGAKEVLLVADVPVWSCGACSEEYTAEGAEEAQHNAVCHYLGRLTPDEIRALRKRLGLTQAEFAEKTDIGIASIKRWENGTVIQNASLDAKLRALDEEQGRKTVRRTPQFARAFPQEVLERARGFKLRVPMLTGAEAA
jgi:putative zinc finger/helix-turn-helix YgiT family protein